MEVEEEVVVEEEQDDLELEVEEEETDEAPESEEDDQEQDPDDEEEDRVVVIGDSSPEDDNDEAPGWVKKVRKVNRKLESENKRLRRELEQRSTAAQQDTPPEVGERPTLKSVGYNDKKYEQALAEYYEKKRQADEYSAKKQKEQEAVQERWQKKQQAYAAKKAEYGFKDFEDAEGLVSNTLSSAQQGILIQGADDSALVVYALGKNPKKLEELAQETDHVSFAFKVAKLESQLKVQNKKAPKPEKRVSGGKTGGLSGTEDQTLSRLRKEAEKTGDYSKVVAYKRKKRNK
jgi:hypothetical protein